MAENVTLADLASTQTNSIISAVNSNNALIENAFSDCLSLLGTQPNALLSNIDMNSNQIINLPAPSTVNSPVRVQDLANFSGSGVITFNTLPAGGSTSSLLHKNSGTNYDATWTLTPSGLTSIGATSSTVTTSNITGTAVLSGSSSGTTTVQASASASGTLTLPAATDTLIGKATTDILTNKTYDTAGTGNVFKAGGVTTSTVTGTGAITLATTPTLITPNIGVATGTSLAATGKITSSSSSAGIGYATGAGSTVTQLTNKTTGVTLNTITGSITLATGSLSAGIANAATFTLTNSSIAATDVVISHHKSGGTVGAYLVWISDMAAGSCKINVANTTGGALNETPVLSFAVIKSVNS